MRGNPRRKQGGVRVFRQLYHWPWRQRGKDFAAIQQGCHNSDLAAKRSVTDKRDLVARSIKGNGRAQPCETHKVQAAVHRDHDLTPRPSPPARQFLQQYGKELPKFCRVLHFLRRRWRQLHIH